LNIKPLDTSGFFYALGFFGMILEMVVLINIYLNKNIKTMRGLLYIIAVILIIGWAFGFFYADAGGIIHILLVIAIIALLLGIIRRA